jgi:hypothetical protein
MQYLKAACGFVCFLILASNVWSMSRWSEARGVYDDVCYLRQAHLFQQFGLGGLDTDLSRDDDHYLASRLKEIGFSTWSDPATIPCHTLMPATNKRVLQYPPGTGLVLALFPQGFQVIPLYVLSTVIVFGFALLGISYARSMSTILLTAGFGCLAIYLMINPAKASYSVAPTMVVCALAGFVTAKIFSAGQPHRLLLTGIVGLLIGLAVNFRLPNLFLSSGYFVFFIVALLMSRKMETALQGMVFGAAFLAGMAPTLAANAINAGSPLRTTYGAVDVMPPELSFSVIASYFADMQFVLLALAGTWTAWMLRRYNNDNRTRQLALVTAANLLVNLAFFLTHPVFTPYYTIPVAMLSLWSLLFAALMQPAKSVELAAPGRWTAPLPDAIPRP